MLKVTQFNKDEYVNELVTRWTKELKVLSQIAEIQPQAAYSAYVHGFRGKFTYFLRTIPDITYCLQPVEDIIRNEFIPAITGGNQCSDKERDLLALPDRLGGFGLETIAKISTMEYESSRKMTKSLVESVIEQQIIFEVQEEEQKKLKAEIKKDRREYHQQNLDELRQSMNDGQRRQNDLIQEPGSSYWLNTIPLEDHNYTLNKQEFWVAIRLRYNWPIPSLPSRCACGMTFDVQHSMSCKKGGFVTHRHNELRDITAKLLSEVCKDVEVEPLLTTLTGEAFQQCGLAVKASFS